MVPKSLALALALSALCFSWGVVTGFAPPPPAIRSTAHTYVRHNMAVSASSTAIPNPFKKLPWNVKKEREREARRLKQERAKLYRQLGIAEDAEYEEIVLATDTLIAKAGNNVKEKIQIEVAKDKILQIRLNERLAGLAAENKEARAMSNYEVEGYVPQKRERCLRIDAR